MSNKAEIITYASNLIEIVEHNDTDSPIDEMGHKYIALPLYEDGGTVTVGGSVDGLDGKIECISIHIEKDGKPNYQLLDDMSEIEGPGPFKRKVVVRSADGKPLKEGMKVWVSMAHAKDCGKGSIRLDMKAGLIGYAYGEQEIVKRIRGDHRIDLSGYTLPWCPADWLVTEQPDTQELINGDARKFVYDYWNCNEYYCPDCPSVENEKRPFERYELENKNGRIVNLCELAQRLDLMRRQRELDAAMMGGGE